MIVKLFRYCTLASCMRQRELRRTLVEIWKRFGAEVLSLFDACTFVLGVVLGFRFIVLDVSCRELSSQPLKFSFQIKFKTSVSHACLALQTGFGTGDL